MQVCGIKHAVPVLKKSQVEERVRQARRQERGEKPSRREAEEPVTQSRSRGMGTTRLEHKVGR